MATGPGKVSLHRRLKLRYLVFVALLLTGIIPLAISSALLISSNRQILLDSEQDYLIRKAADLGQNVNEHLAGLRRQATQLGNGLLLAPGPPIEAKLREPWVIESLRQFLRDNPDFSAVRVMNRAGEGPGLPVTLDNASSAALAAGFREALQSKAAAYRFVAAGPGVPPRVAIAVPLGGGEIVVEVVSRIRPVEEAFQNEPKQGVSIVLIDRDGRALWRDGGPSSAAMLQALLRSDVVRSFSQVPMIMTREYEGEIAGRKLDIVARVSQIAESDWGLVVQKPRAATFAVVNEMVVKAVLLTFLLFALASLVAFVAARQVSQPIQRLAETTHAIAAGDFDRRVEASGLTSELSELAADFNQMSGQLESHVKQLRQAAAANRELFIGSLRAFVAAVDAKDPYTRGHSERVAAVSRTIARHLALSEEIQHKVWIGALLHDVGKIGVEDRILKKSGVLTSDEYDQMKLHTVIGATILSRIEQLREVIPAVRSHHEAWNGRGYPDSLKGEQIHLFARIVAVADCFDAVTTNRPYQQAYSLDFALSTITKLAGSRFDAKVVTAFLRAVEAGEVRPRNPAGERADESGTVTGPDAPRAATA